MISVQQIISDVVADMRVKTGLEYPVFEHGRIDYIHSKMNEKLNSNNLALPMIALVGDFKEPTNIAGKEITLPILFAIETKPETSNPDRYNTTFTTLYELLEAFNEALGDSVYIDMSYPDYDKLDSSYYTGDKNKFNIYTDVLVCEYKVYILNDCTSFIAPETVAITLQAETGGTTVPAPDVLNVAYKSNNAFYAIVESGYRFAGWLMDSITTFTNPLPYIATAAATLKAKFIKVWTLTSSVVGNGTIDAVDGTYDEGASTTVTATPASGSVFSKFTRNAVDSFVNPIVLTFNEAIDLVATFVLTAVNLIVTKVGNGTITPDVGTYPTEPGTEREFTATESDPDYYFDAFYVDEVKDETNPLTLTVNSETRVEGRFTLLQKIMEIFSTIPTSIGDSYGFLDESIFENDSLIKSQAINLGATDFAIVPYNLQGGTIIDLTFIWYATNFTATKCILASGGASANRVGVSAFLIGTSFRLYTSTGLATGNRTIDISQSLIPFSLNEILFYWNGVGGSTANLTVNGTAYTLSPQYSWTGNSYTNLHIFRYITADSYFNELVSYIALAGIFEYCCNNGGGTNLIDSSGNARNAAITTNNLPAFWGGISTHIPYALVRGCSIVDGIIIPRNESDQTKDVNGNALQYPALSGIIEGLTNTEYYIKPDYHVNRSVAAGWKTFAALDALIPDDKFLKVTKTDDAISKVLVNKLPYSTAGNVLNILTEPPVLNQNRKYYPNLVGSNIPTNKPIKIVCVGNSITAGGDEPWRWSAHLYNYIAQEYKWNVTVVNKGIGGTTGTVIIQDFATNIAPEYDENYYCIAFCSEVVNDITSNPPVSPQNAINNMTQIALLCKQAGFDMVAGWLPVNNANGNPLYVEAINIWRANHENYDYLIDTWELIPELGATPNQPLYWATPWNLTETVHPNIKGNYIMGQTFADEFINYILPTYLENNNVQIVNTGYLKLDGNVRVNKGVGIDNEFDFSFQFNTEKTLIFTFYSQIPNILELGNSENGNYVRIYKAGFWNIEVYNDSVLILKMISGKFGVKSSWNTLEITLNGNNTVKLNGNPVLITYSTGAISTAFDLTFNQVSIAVANGINMIGGIKKAYMQDVFDLDFDDRGDTLVRNNYNTQVSDYDHYTIKTITPLGDCWDSIDYLANELKNGLPDASAKLLFPESLSDNAELIAIGAYVGGKPSAVGYDEVSGLSDITISENVITRVVI